MSRSVHLIPNFVTCKIYRRKTHSSILFETEVSKLIIPKNSLDILTLSQDSTTRFHCSRIPVSLPEKAQHRIPVPWVAVLFAQRTLSSSIDSSICPFSPEDSAESAASTKPSLSRAFEWVLVGSADPTRQRHCELHHVPVRPFRSAL